MKKLIGTFIAVAFLAVSANNAQLISKVVLAHAPASLTASPVSQTVVSPTNAIVGQEEEGSKHCERPSKSNPDVGEKDSDKMGCVCQYKCVSGKPEEDRSDPLHKCKNDCKKDQCECSKPVCKS